MQRKQEEMEEGRGMAHNQERKEVRANVGYCSFFCFGISCITCFGETSRLDLVIIVLVFAVSNWGESTDPST